MSTLTLNLLTGTRWMVDETITERRMRDLTPKFFRPFGNVKRETYTVHRGCLIVRHTVRFSDRTERRTVPYLFGMCNNAATPSYDTLCLDATPHPTSIAQARRLIDVVLDRGLFHYGMPLTGVPDINKVLARKSENRSSVRGAPMGDADRYAEDADPRIYVQKIRFVDGDYGADGTYWGGGRATQPLWCGFNAENTIRLYARAGDRWTAAAAFKATYPRLSILLPPIPMSGLD